MADGPEDPGQVQQCTLPVYQRLWSGNVHVVLLQGACGLHGTVGLPLGHITRAAGLQCGILYRCMEQCLTLPWTRHKF